MRSSKLATVGFVAHLHRTQARALAVRLAEWFGARGAVVRVPDADAEGLGLGELAGGDGFAEGLDLVISLGGDGTMLRALDMVFERDVAVLGVNVGHMGYLTELEPSDLDDGLLERLLACEYEIEERMVLQVDVASAGAAEGRWWALNEAVLEKVRTGHMARLAVDINGTPFTTYAADGVIVATPTGSTAYSFSARGPIVSPRHRSLLLTPVSPHMLFDRSLVLDADEELRFRVEEAGSVILTLDGNVRGELDAGDTVTCTGARRAARVATFGERDFHQILKAKFGLPDR